MTEFFIVMAKYWNCYDDHDLLAMVIKATENEEAISVLNTFLQSRDRGIIIPTEKCPRAPFQSPCHGSSSDSKANVKKTDASTEKASKPQKMKAPTQDSCVLTGTCPTDAKPPPDGSQQDQENVCTESTLTCSQQPQSSVPDPKSSEAVENLQHFHHHPGCSNELPPNRVPVVAEVDYSFMPACLQV